MCHNNTRRSKSTFWLDFIAFRAINPKHFQSLLFEGHYVVVPDLMIETCGYLGCMAASLSRATRIKRAAHGSGFRADVDTNGICRTNTLNIFGPALPTATQAQQAVLLRVLIKVVVDGKGHWPASSKGFMLLVRTSSCGAFCVAIAFVYIDGSVIKCCELDEKGNSGKPFTSDTLN
jgi:hypothetical protein